jgi:Condensation domain
LTDDYGTAARQVPAAVSQRLLRMMGHYRGGNGALTCPIVYRLHGHLDGAALSAALTELTARHEALRTTLNGRGTRLTQYVHDPAPVTVNRVDLRATGGADSIVTHALTAELRSEIPIGSWPMRVTLYQTGDRDYVLSIVIQHYVTDGWSNAVLLQELWDLYDQAAAGGAIGLPPVRLQYREFAQWQAGRIGGTAWRQHESYWRQFLAGARSPELPGAPRHGDPSDGHAAIEELRIDEHSVAALSRLARQEHTTLFTAMLAVFYLWLYSVTGQDDLAVGSMFANRLQPEAAGTVGFFANLLVLRTRIAADETFRQLLNATRTTVNGALDHQEVPYHMVRLEPGPHGPVHPEDLMFQMQPWPLDERRSLPGAGAWRIPPPEGLAPRFAFELLISPAASGGLRVLIVFAEKRFDRAWIRQAAADFSALATRAALTADAGLTELCRAQRQLLPEEIPPRKEDGEANFPDYQWR